MARSYEVKAFPSLESLLAEVDAINIATPTTHYEIGMKAIDWQTYPGGETSNRF